MFWSHCPLSVHSRFTPGSLPVLTSPEFFRAGILQFGMLWGFDFFDIVYVKVGFTYIFARAINEKKSIKIYIYPPFYWYNQRLSVTYNIWPLWSLYRPVCKIRVYRQVRWGKAGRGMPILCVKYCNLNAEGASVDLLQNQALLLGYIYNIA